MTDDLTEVDTTEASQTAGLSVMSDPSPEAGDGDGSTPALFMPVLDRIRTSD